MIRTNENLRLTLRAAVLGALGLATGPAFAVGTIILPDPQTSAVLYGDFYSYSLPILAYTYNPAQTGPGNPYYVASGPGQIQDDVVIATGASGTGVNTNFSGMNDAYPTPSGTGGLPYFSTGGELASGDNHPVNATNDPPLAINNGLTWNSTVNALNTYLGGTAPVFYFNNNQENNDPPYGQNMAVWMQVSLFDSTGTNATLSFNFANNCPAGNICISGGYTFDGGTSSGTTGTDPDDRYTTGGILGGPDKDPANYTASPVTSIYPVPGGALGEPNPADFVI